MKPRRHPDESFIEFTLDQLSTLGEELTPKRMFGGHGLYAGLDFFAIIHAGRIYLKTGDNTRPDFEVRGMGPFQPSETQILSNYFEVPVDVLEDAAEFTAWARRSISVAREDTPRPTTRRKPRP